MMKPITNFAILLFILVSCRSENINDRMKQYESQMESFTQKANAIENDSIKQKLYEISMWLFSNEEDTIRMQREPNSTRYKDNPYFLFENYTSYKDLTDNYVNGKTLSYFSKSGSGYSISAIDAFDYPFKTNTIWQELIFNNLKAFPIVPENTKSDLKPNEIKITESGKSTSPKIFKVTYPTGNKTPLSTKIKALIQTEIPSNISRFHFLKTDIGKTQPKNNLNVTLLNMKNSYAEIEITTPEGFFREDDICDQFNWLKIEAKDHTSQYISMSSATGSHRKKTYNANISNLYKELTAKEKYTPEFLSAFFEKANKVIEAEKTSDKTMDKNKHYRFQYFRGMVNEINVDIYDYSKSEIISKEVIYPITDPGNLISSGDFKQIPTTASVYDNEITALTNKPYEIQVDDLKNQITVDQVPALMSKSSIVEFKYPNLISSKVIGEYNRFNKIKEFSFLNKNEKPIDIRPDSINYNSFEKRGSMVNIYDDRIEYYSKRFPEYRTT